MPVGKSAKKALRKSKRRKIRNLRIKENIKKSLKRLRRLISEKKIQEASQFLSQVYKILDKAAKTGVIKANKAARQKSKFSKLISELRNKKS